MNNVKNQDDCQSMMYICIHIDKNDYFFLLFTLYKVFIVLSYNYNNKVLEVDSNLNQN